MRCKARQAVQELHRFAQARSDYRHKNGAITILNSECQVFVKGMDDPNVTADDLDISVKPLIMQDSPSRVAVSESMIMAGELAARWAAQSSIHLPFRCALPHTLPVVQAMIDSDCRCDLSCLRYRVCWTT